MSIVFFGIHLLFIWLCCKKQRYIYYYIAFYFFSTSLMDVTSLISIGGIQIIGRDMFLIGLIAYSVMRKGLRLYKNWTSYSLLFLIVIAIVQIIFGYLSYGMNTQLIAAIRNYGQFFGVILCLYAMKEELDVAAMKKVSYVSFTILGAYLVVYYFLAYGAHIVLRGNAKLYRPVSAIYALCLAFYCLYLLNKDLKSTESKLSPRTLFFYAVTILCRHNSVWVALAMGTLVLIFGYRSVVFQNKRALLQGVALVAGGVFLLFVFRDSNLINGLKVSLGKFNSETTEYNTLGTRIDVWLSALNSFIGIEWVIGQGVGGASRVVYRGIVWQNQLHNAYLQFLMEAGLARLVPVVMLLLGNIVRSVKKCRWEGAAMLAAILAYWLSYGYSMEQAIVIGIILKFAYAKEQKDVISGERA